MPHNSTSGILSLANEPIRTDFVTRQIDERDINVIGAGKIKPAKVEAKPAKAVTPAATAASISTTSGVDKVGGSTLSEKDFKTARLGAAGLQTIAGILNATSQFSQVKSRARLNIMLASHQESAVIASGKGKALREETKGISAGEDAALALVAQGQEFTGNLASKAKQTEELFGAFNAMQVEINSLREAYGLKAQQALFESDIRQGKIARDAAIFDSVLSGGAAALGAL